MKYKINDVLISSFLQPSIFHEGEEFLVIRLQDLQNCGLIAFYPYKRFGGLRKSLALFKEECKIREIQLNF